MDFYPIVTLMLLEATKAAIELPTKVVLFLWLCKILIWCLGTKGAPLLWWPLCRSLGRPTIMLSLCHEILLFAYLTRNASKRFPNELTLKHAYKWWISDRKNFYLPWYVLKTRWCVWSGFELGFRHLNKNLDCSRLLAWCPKLHMKESTSTLTAVEQDLHRQRIWHCVFSPHFYLEQLHPQYCFSLNYAITLRSLLLSRDRQSGI